MALMPAGGRHSGWALLLAVTMSLVVVLASVTSMAACRVGGGQGAATAGGHGHAGHSPAGHARGGYADIASTPEVASSICDPDADHGLPQATHVCMCDLACHAGWSFVETRTEPAVANYAQLRFDWSAQVLVGSTSSMLDRPPKSLADA